MCGILGEFCFDAIPNPPALDLLAHRGPDGQGEWTDSTGMVYLGHTRLAILELTPAGYQPMADASGRYRITFNGEIYNHLSLRGLLPTIDWRGTSDTETLIELLAAKGIEALGLLKGMFAFGLFDTVTETLTVARDRFGIKPLWVSHDQAAFRFSSELTPLLKGQRFTADWAGISEFLAFGRMPGLLPVFSGVHSLPPGGWMVVNKSGPLESGSWWPTSRSFPLPPPATAYTKQVHDLLTKSVEEHLLSDVGVGAFLSGGIDSSIISLLAGRILGKELQTFTVGFPDNAKDDERAIARQVALRAGSTHHEIEVSADNCLEWIPQAVNALDIPTVDAINTFIVAKAVRQTGLKVALSGLGGDELFGGYPSFSEIPYLQLMRHMPPQLRKAFVQLLPPKFKDKLTGLADFSVANLTVARRRFISINKLVNYGLLDGTPTILPPPASFDTMGQISWGELQGYMIPMLLRDSDQMSMAVGLEIRVPFLDHELVETVLSIPQRYKKGQGSKPLLVAAFQNELPTAVYNRPKQGFSLPMDAWLRGPLDSYIQQGIQLAAEILKLERPYASLREFQAHQLHWTRPWNWCILGYWLQKHQNQQQP